MGYYTPLQQINIARLSQTFAANDAERSGVFGGKIEFGLDRKIYIENQSLIWKYSLDPTNTTDLITVGDYVYSLCGKYGLLAAAIIIGGGGSGVIVVPINAVSSNTIWKLRIYSSDFADATNYNNAAIVGKSIEIYDNNNQKMLNRKGDALDFGYTSTGIVFYNIDTTQNSYDFTLFIEGGATGSPVTTPQQPLNISILNEDTKVIDWTGDLKSRYGSFPDLQLFLLDSNSGEYQLSSIQPSINGTPDTFTTITYRGLGTTSNGWITVK